MENDLKTNSELNQKIDKIHNKIQPALYESNLKPVETGNENEKELNSKILKITMTIKEKYPELSKYIEEMQETIPDEKNPDITLQNLKKYADSLTSMLSNYILEHPVK